MPRNPILGIWCKESYLRRFTCMGGGRELRYALQSGVCGSRISSRHCGEQKNVCLNRGSILKSPVLFL